MNVAVIPKRRIKKRSSGQITLDIQLKKWVVSIIPYSNAPGLMPGTQLDAPPHPSQVVSSKNSNTISEVLQELSKNGLIGIMASLLGSGHTPHIFCSSPESGVLGTTLSSPGGGGRKATALPEAGRTGAIRHDL